MSDALAKFWSESCSASVLRDYEAGAVVTLRAGERRNRALSDMVAEAKAKRAAAVEAASLRAELAALEATIDAAYWRFSRSQSSRLYLAPQSAYDRRNAIKARLAALATA